jgi:hypothetical protein
MKKQYLLVLALFAFSCEEEPFSPKTATISKNEGWPAEEIMIEFDNPNDKPFEIIFGTTLASSVATSNGIRATVPNLPGNSLVQVTMKTPNGTVVVSEDFKMRALPSISYFNAAKFSHRLPLKFIIQDKDYYENFNLTICASDNFCTGVYTETKGDTIIIKTPGTNSPKDYTLEISGNEREKMNLNSPLYKESFRLTNVFTYRSSFRIMKNIGKALDKFNIVFNDTQYFPQQLTVTMKSSTGAQTVLTSSNFDIVGAPGYLNATIGEYTVPASLALGTYTVVVKDSNGIEYLPEPSVSFTVTN